MCVCLSLSSQSRLFPLAALRAYRSRRRTRQSSSVIIYYAKGNKSRPHKGGQTRARVCLSFIVSLSLSRSPTLSEKEWKVRVRRYYNSFDSKRVCTSFSLPLSLSPYLSAVIYRFQSPSRLTDHEARYNGGTRARKEERARERGSAEWRGAAGGRRR